MDDLARRRIQGEFRPRRTGRLRHQGGRDPHVRRPVEDARQQRGSCPRVRRRRRVLRRCDARLPASPHRRRHRWTVLHRRERRVPAGGRHIHRPRRDRRRRARSVGYADRAAGAGGPARRGMGRQARARAGVSLIPYVVSAFRRTFGPAKAGHHVLVLLLLATSALAQDTHLLVITGSPGDDEHAQNFHKWATAIIAAAKDKGGLSDATITYLGEKPELDAAQIKGKSTRANVEKAFSDLAAKAQPADEVVIVLIGHGSFDGKIGSFNLPGPDLNTDDYAHLLGALKSQRIVFVNTASSSGAFLQPLAGPGRTIITSTKTGGERNEPVFAQFFADAFTDASADTDRNGRVSIAEAFEYAKSKAAATYTKAGTILTEHATLDDSH